jgi:hypothetical protein
VGGDGNAYIAGHAGSDQSSFPVQGPLDPTFNGVDDAFVARVNRSWRMLDYAGYIGGSGVDGGWGVAVDDDGSAYLTGDTTSAEATFPVTGELDPVYNGGGCDAWVGKVSFAWWESYLPLVVRSQ